MKSCSLARSYISPTLSLREDGTIDLIYLCLQMNFNVKKVQTGSETISYTSLVSRAIPAMPVSGESLELSSNITSELTEDDMGTGLV